MQAIFGHAPAGGKPVLLNSASPWATTKADLYKLFKCTFTTAVTTRTTTLTGFAHDEAVHQYCFFEPGTNKVQASTAVRASHSPLSSLNTLGYSPIRLDEYLSYIEEIVEASGQHPDPMTRKPFIVSVTGSANEVVQCAIKISACSDKLNSYPLHMEVNLSCPNIAGKPPPAYSKEALTEYLVALGNVPRENATNVKFGIKSPPYTHAGQFQDIEDALIASTADGKDKCPIHFITATNTLGNCLVVNVNALGTPNEDSVNDIYTRTSALESADGTGIGGMAGPSIHALSLGNVARLRQLLDRHQELREIAIIGVGGVSDRLSYLRMRAVGANAVALATALGQQGVDVFERIATDADVPTD